MRVSVRFAVSSGVGGNAVARFVDAGSVLLALMSAAERIVIKPVADSPDP